MFSHPQSYQMQIPYPYQMAFQPKKECSLYIGDLDEQITEEILYNYFSRFGRVCTTKVMRHSTTKKSRGFGFLSFFQQQDAENARIASNHAVLIRKPIRVIMAKSPRELNFEANVFLKNVPLEVDIHDIDSVFSEFGRVFSSKINTDEDGNSTGYGYVQFEEKEEAEKALASAVDGKIMVKGQEIEAQIFKRKTERELLDSRNNLYIKNFPSDLDEAAVEEKIRNHFKDLGVITSLLVKKDQKFNKCYSFVCFSSHLEAQAVFEHINSAETNPFGGDEKLYVNWVQKLYQRKRELSETFGHTMCNTNLFVKNIKASVSEEEFKTKFSKFGEITSLVLKTPPVRESQSGIKFPETQFAFINYKTADEARIAMTNSIKENDIINLFESINGKSPMVFVAFHMKKDHFDQFKHSQKRNMMPMMMYPPFGGMPPMGGMPMGGMPMGGMPMGRPPMPYNMGGMPQNAGQGYMGHRGGYTGGRPRGGPRRGGPRGGAGGRGGHHPHGHGHGHGQGHHSQQEQEKYIFESGNLSIPLLKENLKEFTELDQTKQRNILGEILFPMVEKLVPDNKNNLAPKVTGMLIDLEVFDVPEIIDFIEDENSLKERVNEAVELLNNEA